MRYDKFMLQFLNIFIVDYELQMHLIDKRIGNKENTLIIDK
jgi:hypothetical protein